MRAQQLFLEGKLLIQQFGNGRTALFHGVHMCKYMLNLDYQWHSVFGALNTAKLSRTIGTITESWGIRTKGKKIQHSVVVQKIK
jgi:hypothetical protein